MKDPTCELALTLLCQLYGALRAARVKPAAARAEAVEALDHFRGHVEARHVAGRYHPKAPGAYPAAGGAHA